VATENEGEPRLPFPIKPLIINGVVIEEYVIPDERRAAVLAELYPFDPVPALDDEFHDLHSGRTFKVREFRVTREDGFNCLVSPYYEEGGGTVIDWVPPSAGLMEQSTDAPSAASPTGRSKRSGPWPIGGPDPRRGARGRRRTGRTRA
jgi:hypothetical protein